MNLSADFTRLGRIGGFVDEACGNCEGEITVLDVVNPRHLGK
jgi:hypothetical protein